MTTDSVQKFLSAERAGERVRERGGEYAVVRNPGYVFPSEEYCPLAPKIRGPVDRLVAVVQDMDGTTTTTETLCLHSLETMVRRITGRFSRSDWAGLDRECDYPHIIGNSTTRHVEYLVETYAAEIREDCLRRALIMAAAWTLSKGADAGRREEVRATLRSLGWIDLLADDPEWQALLRPDVPAAELDAKADGIAARHASLPLIGGFNDRVRAAIDIYYQRYHEILGELARGRGKELARDLTGGRPLIEPMPGVAVFLALVRGWLGADAGVLYDELLASCRVPLDLPAPDEGRRRLAELGRRLASAPVRVAVVTSSIRYEADIVLDEVRKIVREQVRGWPVQPAIAEGLERAQDLFDGIITATDSSEIRLKPHRDLYSIALHALGVAPSDFGSVVGFEDSRSGTIAIRAAGVGLCVAVPFADTAGHDLSAAAHVLRGGLPEAILKENLFLAG